MVRNVISTPRYRGTWLVGPCAAVVACWAPLDPCCVGAQPTILEAPDSPSNPGDGRRWVCSRGRMTSCGYVALLARILDRIEAESTPSQWDGSSPCSTGESPMPLPVNLVLGTRRRGTARPRGSVPAGPG